MQNRHHFTMLLLALLLAAHVRADRHPAIDAFLAELPEPYLTRYHSAIATTINAPPALVRSAGQRIKLQFHQHIFILFGEYSPLFSTTVDVRRRLLRIRISNLK